MVRQEMRVGIVGMGTIGRAIANALDNGDLPVRLEAVNSRNDSKLREFVHTLQRRPEIMSLDTLIDACDLVIEAATQAIL